MDLIKSFDSALQLLQSSRTGSHVLLTYPPSLDMLHRVPPTGPPTCFLEDAYLAPKKGRFITKAPGRNLTVNVLSAGFTSSARELKPTSVDPRSTRVSLPTLKQDVRLTLEHAHGLCVVSIKDVAFYC
jgi:hypothetical protein